MTRCLQIASLYNWDQRLCIGPDVSHTVQVSDCKTEGNGVGDFEAPPVSAEGEFPLVKDILALSEQSKVLISVNIKLADGVSFVWDTFLSDKNLFVQLPQTFLPSFSKESFVRLMEFAEDSLKCCHMVICLQKKRLDRACLLKVFMYMGFRLLPPLHPLIPADSSDIMYLATARSGGDDGDDDDSG